VRNYLFSGAETRVCNHSGMNPFMLAIKNGSTHLNVAKAMAKMDPSLVTLKLDSGLTVSNWAQEKGHDGFFKVCFVIALCLASLLPFLYLPEFYQIRILFFVFEESHYVVFCTPVIWLVKILIYENAIVISGARL